MLLKIHARGKGVGAGPVGYLLGEERDRECARVLRGNPEMTVALIDSLKFSRKYTSGVLSFAERDIPEAHKQEIMSQFERALMPGLTPDNYQILWVEHTDKNRLELNFVIPNCELQSGKFLQPYYHKADLVRVNAWQEIARYEFGLADPNAPERRRSLVTANDLPRDTKKAAETITESMTALVAAGLVKDRKGVIETLESGGFKVLRETPQSISVANPTAEGGRNIRLKGFIYERDFEAGAGFESAIRENIKRYSEGTEQRIREARETLSEALRIKTEYHRTRYPEAHTKLDALQNANTPQPWPQLEPRGVSRGAGLDELLLEANQRATSDSEPARSAGRAGEAFDLRWEAMRPSLGRPVPRPSRKQANDNQGVLEHDRARDAIARAIRENEHNAAETNQRISAADRAINASIQHAREDTTATNSSINRAGADIGAGVDAARAADNQLSIIERAIRAASNAIRKAAEQAITAVKRFTIGRDRGSDGPSM